MLYLNYDRNNAYEGEIIWSNNKPIISCRDLLWGGLEDENELITNINNRVNLGYTNLTILILIPLYMFMCGVIPWIMLMM